MKLRLFSGEDVARALPMAECVAVMKEAFAAFSGGRAVVPQRTVLEVGVGNAVLVKPAWLPSKDSSEGGECGGNLLRRDQGTCDAP